MVSGRAIPHMKALIYVIWIQKLRGVVAVLFCAIPSRKSVFCIKNWPKSSCPPDWAHCAMFESQKLVKLICDTCNFVINEFNPTSEAQNIGNGAFQNAPFANGSFPNGGYSCLWA